MIYTYALRSLHIQLLMKLNVVLVIWDVNEKLPEYYYYYSYLFIYSVTTD